MKLDQQVLETNRTLGELTGQLQGGCPDFSGSDFPEVPVTYDGEFVSGIRYIGAGHQEPVASCNGPYAEDLHKDGRNCYMAEDHYPGVSGYHWKWGSVVVLPGCRVKLYQDHNYGGDSVEFTGPALIPRITFHYSHDYGYGVAGSYVWSCKQKMPDCQPTDQWQTIDSFDNTQSDFEAEFTYSKTVGTTFSQEIQEHISISKRVEGEVSGGFWKIFGAGVGISKETGYDWTAVSKIAMSETTTTQVKITVPAHQKLQLQRTVGQCGHSVVSTEMMRAISSHESSQGLTETVRIWRD